MSNEQVYAAGLLNRALDPATQPPEIRAFLQAEIDLLNDIIVRPAVDAVEEGMWNDPEYLESIRQYGQKVTISEGGSHSLTLNAVMR
jgi:hypothetical protein